MDAAANAADAENVIKFRFRGTGFILPDNPSDEELALDWTLSASDKKAVFQMRGDDNLIRHAVQICVLRKYGLFLDDYASVAPSVLGYICRQLNVRPVTGIGRSDREKTEDDCRRSIREYLGFRPFDEEAREQVEGEILRIAKEEFYPENLVNDSIAFLRKNRIELPSRKLLEQTVNTVFRKVEKRIFLEISAQVPGDVKAAVDQLLQGQESSKKSEFFSLDDYPKEATPKQIAGYLNKYNRLLTAGIDRVHFRDVPVSLLKKLRDIAKSHSVAEIRDFPEEKRYAVCVSFLYELRKSYLDNLVYMHGRYMTDIIRQARHQYEREIRNAGRKHTKGVLALANFGDEVLERLDSGAGLDGIEKRKGFVPELRSAVSGCRNYLQLQGNGYLSRLYSRCAGFRKYFREFVNLKFSAVPDREHFLVAIETARDLYSGKLKQLPVNASDAFVPAGWMHAMKSSDSKKVLRTWELSLGLALKDALLTGEVFLPESRSVKPLWALAYDDLRWEEEKVEAYDMLNLSQDADGFLSVLTGEFNETLKRTLGRLKKNRFVRTGRNGQVRFCRDKALSVSPDLKKLRQIIAGRLPRIRIEKLLKEVDALCGFTSSLKPVDTGVPGRAESLPALRAALTAHGTNLGISAVAGSNEKITADMLQHVTRTCLRSDSIRNANTKLADFICRLNGRGPSKTAAMSSSDGQRFGVQGRSLITSFYPRYFGYYDKAVTVYTHVSRSTVFSTMVICCGDREAWYVLNGLLENDCEVQPSQHHTDTHGYSDHVFALCSLLGFQFMPRLADLHRQSLYKINKSQDCGPLEPMFKGTVDVRLIAEQWDRIVRIAAALQNRIVPAHVIVRKLAASSSFSPVAKALAELGKLLKTIYLLDYMDDESVRRQVHRMLCHGEQRQSVAGHVFFANKGQFRSGDLEQIMNRASCLSLLSNAIVCWNSIHIGKIIHELKEEGYEISDGTLADLFPLFHEHVIVNGQYDFT